MIQITSIAKISEVTPNLFNSTASTFEEAFSNTMGLAEVFMTSNPNKGFVSHSLTVLTDTDEQNNKTYGVLLIVFTTD